jgi:hypothetical protein
MLKSIFWGHILYSDHSEHIHRGHITVTPPVPPDPYMAVWFIGIMFVVVFALIGIPLISIWWDIKKHPNKPVKRVAKK